MRRRTSMFEERDITSKFYIAIAVVILLLGAAADAALAQTWTAVGLQT